MVRVSGNRFTASVAIASIFLFLLFYSTALAQPNRGPRTDEEIGTPTFKLSPVVVFADSTHLSRVLIALRIPHSSLIFLKQDSGYKATMSVAAELRATDRKSRKKPPAAVRIWTDSVRLSSYAETVRRTDQINLKYPVDVPPGKYKLKVRLTDLDTRKFTEQEAEVTLFKRNADSLSVTPLVLASWIDNSKTPPLYNAASSDVFVAGQDSGWIYFQISPAGSGTIKVQERIVFDRGAAFKDTTRLIEPTTSSVQAFAFSIPIERMKAGLYQHSVVIEQAGQRIARIITYRIGSKGLTSQITDIDLAIRQLRYLISDKKVDSLLAIPRDKREEALRKFWQQRDPKTGDATGPMQEYYQRIEIANNRFSKTRNGWETDRGKVYILFGEPSDIDSHLYVTQGNPYEVWYYSHINRRFMFVDQDGFGEFRLTSPLWD